MGFLAGKSNKQVVMHIRKNTGAPSDARDVRSLVGPVPERAGDRKSANAYIEKINTTLCNDALSTPERRKLYKQKARWKKRAAGLDARWNAVGVRPGRPVVKGSAVKRGLNAEDLDDPILARIEAKFGHTRRPSVFNHPESE